MPSDLRGRNTRLMKATKGPFLRSGTPCRAGSRKPAAEPKPRKRVPQSESAIGKARAAGVMCRHCKERTVNRPRGLCWHCYYAPGVAEKYPSTSKYARRGTGNFTGQAPLPPAPTTAAPGTPEKVLVMERRANLREAIFHPADARWEGDALPLIFLKALSENPSGLVNER